MHGPCPSLRGGRGAFGRGRSGRADGGLMVAVSEEIRRLPAKERPRRQKRRGILPSSRRPTIRRVTWQMLAFSYFRPRMSAPRRRATRAAGDRPGPAASVRTGERLACPLRKSFRTSPPPSPAAASRSSTSPPRSPDTPILYLPPRSARTPEGRGPHDLALRPGRPLLGVELDGARRAHRHPLRRPGALDHRQGQPGQHLPIRSRRRISSPRRTSSIAAPRSRRTRTSSSPSTR